MRILFLLITLSIFNVAANADVKIKVCEDWIGIGKFQIIGYKLRPPASKPVVVRGNVGRYSSCISKISKTKQCKGRALCTCEDWDEDGRFGIVKNANKKYSSKIVKELYKDLGFGYIGRTYYGCIHAKKRKNYKNTNAIYYSCEDWNKDGAFGLVKHHLEEKQPKPIVIKANYGHYQNCRKKKSSVRQCKGSSLCTCEDWNKDGRFGIVKYNGEVIEHEILRKNVGTYYQCLKKMKKMKVQK